MQKTIPFLISTFDSIELTLPPFVEPSQHNEPPIPGQSQSSESHEDSSSHEPEPEVAPMQSREEPFGKSPLYFFHSYQLSLSTHWTICSSSRYSLLPHYHLKYAHQLPPAPPLLLF
ncbi:hypothetical protein O181_086131 [Austropuccinia psidii MF-1]|uniref:Uncharacterized protein n=1 Tax=Austropuccinia psidii MF-1 TaxID=1389203 RepID=A0A9Q3IKD0_9BASI|nr:hypothetical protein [Austropuccinia psidii MF-1]